MFITWICFLFLSSIVRGIEWYEEGNPVFLTEANIQTALSDKESIKVVKFFAPFCGYCRYLKNFVDEYKNNNMIHPNLKFYEINCQNVRHMCAQFGIRSYPVMMVFDENRKSVAEFDGLYPKHIIHNTLFQFNVKAKELGERLLREKNISPPQEQKNIVTQQQPSKVDNKASGENKQPEVELKNEQKEQISQKQKQEKDQPTAQIIKTDDKAEKEQSASTAGTNIQNIQKIDKSIKEGKQMLQNQNLAQTNKEHSEDLGIMKYILYGVGALVVIAYGWHVHKTGIKEEKHQNSEHDRMEQNIRNEETQPLSK